jgi:cell division transport system ATP-binding protein
MFQPHSTIIELKNATIYQKDNLILKDVNFSLLNGEFAYLIGKTGSGKSTLLKVLYGDLSLQNGEGHVVGFNLNDLNVNTIPKLRRRLGIIFQDFQLLMDRDIYKNLYFVLQATGWANKTEIEKRIDEVLNSVGMIGKKFSMPHRLSGGEQQRIVIARALLNHPNLIIADEPTGNLDPETSIEIMELILRISKEQFCAVFMATHDHSIIKQYPAKTYRCENQNITDAHSLSLF